jgi:tripartite-type tricarboxylate transporter receptor subunit TctC
LLPLSSGTASDIAARTLVPYMGEYLGHPLVLINKPGANGAIAVVEVARAKPDGYTFGWANLPILVIHNQLRKLPNDPNEFVYVVSPNYFDYMVLVSKDAP